MSYEYTTKEGRLDEQFEALRDHWRGAIIDAMDAGFGGDLTVKLPRPKWKTTTLAYPDGTHVISGRDVIVWDFAFAAAVYECLDREEVMAQLLEAVKTGSVPDTFAIDCKVAYLNEHLDDIVRVAWDDREVDE